MQRMFFGGSRGPQLGLFLLLAIPTALVCLYFAFLASDVYLSESQFVVRTPQRSTPTSLGSLLMTGGFSKAADDSETVRDYILSRDALRVLVEKIQLDAGYANPAADIFSRFGGIDPDRSFEALHRYYRRKVDVQTDTSSSVVTLTVRAFNARDAQAANRILLEKSEELVNRLNERGRQDLVRHAQTEVAAAERRAHAAAQAVSSYRSAQNVLDPERQATSQLQQMSKLTEELVATEAQLAQLNAFTPQNPQIPAVANRARIIQQEIAKENTRLTGGGQASLSNKAATFQHLALEADFATKQLASALASLESARGEAQRQQVYIERVAQPNLPDSAQEPKRLRSVAASILLGLAAWGILSMLLAALREHQD
jgi:capsular polysaccharide transport system permease protein